MKEKQIIDELKLHFNTVQNPVLKFINHNTDQTEIVVKGTVEEWSKLLENLR